MQIVIDIDEYLYKTIKTLGLVVEDGDAVAVSEAIMNGTPIPKGHGKIIDIADLLDRICLDDTDENREDNVGEILTLEDIDFIPAIIEAESEDEDVEYQRQIEQLEHDILYEPTFNPEDGSM